MNNSIFIFIFLLKVPLCMWDLVLSQWSLILALMLLMASLPEVFSTLYHYFEYILKEVKIKKALKNCWHLVVNVWKTFLVSLYCQKDFWIYSAIKTISVREKKKHKDSCCFVLFISLWPSGLFSTCCLQCYLAKNMFPKAVCKDALVLVISNWDNFVSKPPEWKAWLLKRSTFIRRWESLAQWKHVWTEEMTQMVTCAGSTTY